MFSFCLKEVKRDLKRNLLSVLCLLILFSFANLIWPCPTALGADTTYWPSYYVKAEKNPAEMTWLRAGLFGGVAIPHSPDEFKFNGTYHFQLEYQASPQLLIGVGAGLTSYSVENFDGAKASQGEYGIEARAFLSPIGTVFFNPYAIGLLQGVNLFGINHAGEYQNDWVFDASIGIGSQFELHEGVSLDVELRYLDVKERKGLLLQVGPSFPFGL